MVEYLTRFGLLILAGIIVFLARRLHTKSGGKSVKAQKITATLFVFVGGIALLGTVVGGWMGTISKASPYIAAGMFVLSAGGLFVDWWTDKVPDKFAFYCALVLPLAIVFGLAQIHTATKEIGRHAHEVSSTINNAGK